MTLYYKKDTIRMGNSTKMEKAKDLKTSLPSEIYNQFTWFKEYFEPPVQAASDEFFNPGFEYKLVSISENMNVLTQNESFFVTKVQLDEKNDVFIRISAQAIQVILDKILGKSSKKFDLSNISDLEAKIITTFNEFLYSKVSGKIDKTKLDRKPVTVNLSYFLRNVASDESARLVLSFPKASLAPESLPPVADENKIDEMIFRDCMVDVRVKVGSTKFTVNDIKTLSVGDIVVFDNSDAKTMVLYYNNIVQPFILKQNEDIIESHDPNDRDKNEGDEDMDTSSLTSLWDSLQIEITAEFETIKISLGDLKNIQEGLVVDVSSVYNNKVSLRVGEQVVAEGELVIVNDRYGVKVNKVTADQYRNSDSVEGLVDMVTQAGANVSVAPNSALSSGADTGSGDEFDYSDFDVDE